MTDARPHAAPSIRLRLLGTETYTDALTRMREWTAARQAARKAALAGEALPAAAPAVMPATGEASLRRDWPDLAEAATAGDEIWLMQHPPVFTLGMNSQPEHLLNAGDIPVVPTERGGQITYHGPGQIMAYLMLDLRARRLGIRTLVERIEDALIDCLGQYGRKGHPASTSCPDRTALYSQPMARHNGPPVPSRPPCPDRTTSTRAMPGRPLAWPRSPPSA